MPEGMTIYELSKNGQLLDVLESNSADCFVSQRRKGFSLPVEFIARHSDSFVAYHEGEADIPPARFKTLKQAGRHLFEVQKESNGTYTIKNVPVYKAHPDTRKYGVVCDRKFLDRMVKNFYSTVNATAELFGTSDFSWRPKVHYGHTPDDPDIAERENAAFLDNLSRVEDFLFADYVGLDKSTLDKLIGGKYPDRSAEVDLRRARLLSVAVLGFRTPHFALPQMTPQQLRKQYLAVIEKNAADVEKIEHYVFLKEDFGMATKKAKHAQIKIEDLTPEIVAKFFLKKETDEEMQALFEEAVSKHCDMMGGGMPQGGGLMQIIQQVMQQMMSQKMNQTPAGPGGQAGGPPTQMNASDLLDLESYAHHEKGEQDLDEEGTSVAEGGESGDAGVDDDGSPSGVEEDDDTISEEGKVVKSAFSSKIQRAKHTLRNIPDRHTREQMSALLDDVGEVLGTQQSVMDKQTAKLNELAKEFQVQKSARRKEKYSHRLTKMFENSNPNVTSEAAKAKHLKFVIGLPEAQAEQYLTNLEDVPAVTRNRHVSKNELIDPNAGADRMSRAKHQIESNRALRKSGVKAEHLAAVDLVDSILNDDFSDEE